MSAQNTFDIYIDQQGWNELSQRDVLERYIENQQDDEAFVEFLREAAESEGVKSSGRDLEDIAAETGWNDSSTITLMLRYIENQDLDDAFEDFLSEQAEFENSYSAGV